MVLLVGGLVDANARQAVEAVAGLGIERIVDASARGPHALPVDAHELGDNAAIAVDAQPRHLLLERTSESRRMVGPGDGGRSHAVHRASSAECAIFKVGLRWAEIERTPATRTWRAVVDG